MYTHVTAMSRKVRIFTLAIKVLQSGRSFTVVTVK